MTQPTSSMSLQVPILIERIAQDVVRFRTMPPVKIDMIGSSWVKSQSLLRKKVSNELRKMDAAAWTTGQVWHDVIRTTISLEFEPPARTPHWTTPVHVVLDCLRAELGQGYQCVFVPRINFSMVAKNDDLSAELVQEHVSRSVGRMIEGKGLREVVATLARTRVTLEHLSVPVPVREHDSHRKQRGESARTRTLRSVAIDHSQSNQGKHITGIEDRAQHVLELIHDAAHPSILLVGPSGVGKSALLHRVAWLLQSSGSTRKVWSTTGSRIVSGMSGLGMWQERVLKMIRELADTQGIVHVDSLAELVEAGKIQGQPGVASMLRHAIASGRIQVIAELTPDQMQRIEKEDPMLLRVFTRYELGPLDDDTMDEILRQSVAETRQISSAALAELRQLHRRFATYSVMPAPALRLLKTIAEDLPEGQAIETHHVTQAFSAQTGLPAFLLEDSIPIDLEAIRAQLTSHVIGQPEPIDLVVDLLATFKTRLMRGGRPLASLLFIGPTGVGKTEMAKAIAKVMYNDSNRMIRIDMSEYANPWSTIRLIGRPGEGDGTLVSPIREQPFSVVLLDEFEKADPAVFDLLLQLLGEGRLTDSLGRTADFRNAIVIMTSNLGVESFRADGFGFAHENPSYRQHFERELKKFVRPELLGRIDRVIPFSPLSPDIVQRIVQRELQVLRSRAGFQGAGIQLHIDDASLGWLAKKGYQPKYGARSIRRAIEQHLVAPIAAKMDEGGIKNLHTAQVEMRQDVLHVETQYSSPRAAREVERTWSPLNSLRELRQKAMLVERSAEFRRVENELERMRRQRKVLEKSMKKVVAVLRRSEEGEPIRLDLEKWTRRQQGLQRQLGELDKLLHALLDRRERVAKLVAEIVQFDRQKAMDWFQGLVDHSEKFESKIDDLGNQLRSLVMELQGKGEKDSNKVNVFVLGRDMRRADLLWRTYMSMARKHNWIREPMILMPYDPLLDKTSIPYQKRQAKGNAPAPMPIGIKSVYTRIRGAEDETGERPYIIDVLSVDPAYGLENLEAIPANAIGVVLHCGGHGVYNWFANEAGIHHVIHDMRTLTSKRGRYRVEVTDGQLKNWVPPADWNEVPTRAERDPRRVYHVGLQVVHDPFASTHAEWHGRTDEDAILEMIEEQYHLSLWLSIGFHPVPRSAQYGNEDIREDYDDLGGI